MKMSQAIILVYTLVTCVYLTAQATVCVDDLPDRCDKSYCKYPGAIKQCKKTCNLCTVVIPTNSTVNISTTSTTTTSTPTTSTTSTVTTQDIVNSTEYLTKVHTVFNSGCFCRDKPWLLMATVLLWILIYSVTS